MSNGFWLLKNNINAVFILTPNQGAKDVGWREARRHCFLDCNDETHISFPNKVVSACTISCIGCGK